jgi:predicted transcriptional regulator
VGKDLADFLAPTSTTKERVEGILSIGMAASELAELTETTESSVRHWLSGRTEPRPEAEMALDYTRAVVKALLDAGMEPERIYKWLMSLDPEHFGSDRPFDVLKTAPMRVLTAALEIALEAGARV